MDATIEEVTPTFPTQVIDSVSRDLEEGISGNYDATNDDLIVTPLHDSVSKDCEESTNNDLGDIKEDQPTDPIEQGEEVREDDDDSFTTNQLTTPNFKMRSWKSLGHIPGASDLSTPPQGNGLKSVLYRSMERLRGTRTIRRKKKPKIKLSNKFEEDSPRIKETNIDQLLSKLNNDIDTDERCSPRIVTYYR